MDAKSFFDELGKIKLALDPWLGKAGIDTALGTASLLRHRARDGGRSAPEQKTLQALSDQDLKGEDVLPALKAHKGNVSAQERAGSGLAYTGAGLAGFGGSRLLNRSFMTAEKGGTSRAEVGKLVGSMFPGQEASLAGHLLYDPEAGFEQAHHIPKGGYSLTQIEKLRKAHIPEDTIDYAMKNGLTILPGKASPHTVAHELGHAAFGRMGMSKLVRRVATPSMLGGAVGAGVLASQSDPDSVSAKAAPLLAAAGLVPKLGEEAYASLKGLSGMRAAGMSPEVIRAGQKQLGKAFGSYASKYLLPAMAAPYLIRKFRQHGIAKREQAGLETSQDLSRQISALQGK